MTTSRLAVGDGALEVVGRAEFQVDEDVLGILHEAADGGLDAELGARHDAVDDADPEASDQLPVALADALLKLVEVGEQLSGGRVGRLAERRQPEAAPAPLAKLPAELSLQRRQMGAERGGRKVQRDLRIGEAARRDERDEDAQQAEIDIVQTAHLCASLARRPRNPPTSLMLRCERSEPRSTHRGNPSASCSILRGSAPRASPLRMRQGRR